MHNILKYVMIAAQVSAMREPIDIAEK